VEEGKVFPQEGSFDCCSGVKIEKLYLRIKIFQKMQCDISYFRGITTTILSAKPFSPNEPFESMGVTPFLENRTATSKPCTNNNAKGTNTTLKQQIIWRVNGWSASTYNALQC